MQKTATRVFIDCREFPSETNCSLRISGTREEVLAAAAQHAVSVHKHAEGPALSTNLESALHQEA